jgi:hypothetical protein
VSLAGRFTFVLRSERQTVRLSDRHQLGCAPLLIQSRTMLVSVDERMPAGGIAPQLPPVIRRYSTLVLALLITMRVPTVQLEGTPTVLAHEDPERKSGAFPPKPWQATQFAVQIGCTSPESV